MNPIQHRQIIYVCITQLLLNKIQGRICNKRIAVACLKKHIGAILDSKQFYV